MLDCVLCVRPRGYIKHQPQKVMTAKQQFMAGLPYHDYMTAGSAARGWSLTQAYLKDRLFISAASFSNFSVA
jgi:hypothetical protein